MVDYRPEPHALSIHSYKSDVLQVKEDLQVKILLKEILGATGVLVGNCSLETTCLYKDHVISYPRDKQFQRSLSR